MLCASIKYIFSKEKSKEEIVYGERVEEEHNFIVKNGFIEKRLVNFIGSMC